ncbi:MAG: hypothetical protein C0594_03425 [Marinilabiliales bacterium]|nr:MAG: hypothetical protein C0594_03425 [Marinilabiliales bacterium]
MAFPFSYTQSISINKEEDPQILLAILSARLTSEKPEFIVKSDQQTGIEFHTNSSLFAIVYCVEIEASNNKVYYKIGLKNLIYVILVLLIVAALISKFSVNAYLWFSLIFVVSFYLINLFIISSTIGSKIRKAISDWIYDEEEEMMKSQQEWATDPNRCPACGSYITKKSSNCNACGIKLPRDRIPVKPLDITGLYKNEEINYSYKQKEE